MMRLLRNRGEGGGRGYKRRYVWVGGGLCVCVCVCVCVSACVRERECTYMLSCIQGRYYSCSNIIHLIVMITKPRFEFNMAVRFNQNSIKHYII